jgi:hypothetical protein
LDGAHSLEELEKIIFRRVEREISNVDARGYDLNDLRFSKACRAGRALR